MLSKTDLASLWKPTLHHESRQPVCQVLVSEDADFKLQSDSAPLFQVQSGASLSCLRGGAALGTSELAAKSPSSASGLSPPLPPFEVELSSDEVVVLSQPGVVHSPSPDVGHERPLRVTPAPRFEGRESSGDTEDAAGEGPDSCTSHFS